MYFSRDLIVKKVPAAIIKRTQENMDVYHLDLADAFEEAVFSLAKAGTKLRKAWYHNDFREYIPSAYREEYLDFSIYPLKY